MFLKFLVAATAVLSLTVSPMAQAETWPSKPIKMIVPFNPGGGTDIATRAISEEFAKQIGTSVIVENRGGAGGIIGTQAGADAAPDGYTLGLSTISTFGGLQANEQLSKNVTFDALNDFEFVTTIGTTPRTLVVSSETAINNYQQFLDHVKQNPGKLSYAVVNGTLDQINGKIFQLSTNTSMVEVPYAKSGATVQLDVRTNRVNAMFETLPTVTANVNAGFYRLLAVSNPVRLASHPTVPTFAELGLNSMDYTSAYGVTVPKGTPAVIVDRLNRALVAAINNPQVQERLKNTGITPLGDSPSESRKLHVKNYNTVISAAKLLKK